MILQPLYLLIAINGTSLVALLTIGYKVLRFINRIEFRTDLLWQDYEDRMAAPAHIHRRSKDRQ